MIQPLTNRSLRPATAADKLGISLPTLWRWARLNPTFPRPRKLSNRVTVFDEAELDAFVAAQGATSPAPPAPVEPAPKRGPGRPRKVPLVGVPA